MIVDEALLRAKAEDGYIVCYKADCSHLQSRLFASRGVSAVSCGATWTDVVACGVSCQSAEHRCASRQLPDVQVCR